jgi:hypothetical protein
VASYAELQARLAALLERFVVVFPDARTEQARAFGEAVTIAMEFADRNARQVAELDDVFERSLAAWGRIEQEREKQRAGRARGAEAARRARMAKQENPDGEKVKSVLRLRRQRGLSKRSIAEAVGLSRRQVAKILARSGSNTGTG